MNKIFKIVIIESKRRESPSIKDKVQKYTTKNLHFLCTMLHTGESLKAIIHSREISPNEDLKNLYNSDIFLCCGGFSFINMSSVCKILTIRYYTKYNLY